MARMKFNLIALLIVFTSCNHYRDNSDLKKAFMARSNNPNDTLVVYHSECTECSELNIIEGHLTIPKDLIDKITWTDGFIVTGNFPLKIIEASPADFFPLKPYHYKVIGRVIAVDSNNAIGKVPVLYVTSWRRLKPRWRG